LIEKLQETLGWQNTNTWRSRAAIALCAVALTGLVCVLFFNDPAVGWWHSLFKTEAAVEGCDRTLGAVQDGLDYSGIYAGVIEESQNHTTEVQLKLVRNGYAVQGSYYRQGVCGSIFGEINGGWLFFTWKWAGASGRGRAKQSGQSITGTSGYNQDIEGASNFTLLERKSS
jgi:hypothetical protein